MILNIGSFKHRIMILARPQVPDSQAGIDYINNNLGSVWSLIEPVKGSQNLYRQQIDESITHKIYIRYLRWITSENWLIYNKYNFLTNINYSNNPIIENVSYRIRHVKNIGQEQRFLELQCEEQYQS